MGAADGTFDAGAGNQLGDGAGEYKIGGEAPVACGNWHQPTRTVNERCHCRGSDLDGCRSRGFQVLGGAAGNDLLWARRAATDGDVLCGVGIGIHGEGQEGAPSVRVWASEAQRMEGICDGTNTRAGGYG